MEKQIAMIDNKKNNKLNRSEYGWKIWQLEFDNLNMIFGFSEFF